MRHANANSFITWGFISHLSYNITIVTQNNQRINILLCQHVGGNTEKRMIEYISRFQHDFIYIMFGKS